MNPIIGWGLAAIGTGMAYYRYGWAGVALAVSVVVFWLLLQFSRALRAMTRAGKSPIGHVANAVMLHTKLRQGQRLMDIIVLTQSLGEKLADDPETYRWTDAAGDSVQVELLGGRCTVWTLQRAADPGAPQVSE